MNKPRRWLVLLVVLLVGACAYLLYSAGRTIRSTQTTPTTPVSRPLVEKDEPVQPAGGRREDGDTRGGLAGAAIATRASRASAPDLAALARRDDLLRARLPEFTQALRGDADPVADARDVSPARGLGPDGQEPALVAFPTEVSFEAPEPVVVRAYFEEDGRTIAAERLTARFLHERLGEIAQLDLHDDGGDGDELAGDFVYSGRLEIAPERARELRGTYVVAVRGRSATLVERAVSTGFLYSAPLAQPTGRFRDLLVDGSLVIEAELDVFERGRFHAEATLAGSDGRPIAWAQNAAVLEPGRRWLRLTFYGLALHESEVDGPYVLRSFALSTAGEMPNQKNRLLRNAYRTAPYRAETFTDRPYAEASEDGAAPPRGGRAAPLGPPARTTEP